MKEIYIKRIYIYPEYNFKLLESKGCNYIEIDGVIYNEYEIDDLVIRNKRNILKVLSKHSKKKANIRNISGDDDFIGIKNIVFAYFNYTESLTNRSRYREILQPIQYFIYFLKYFTKYSDSEIGLACGGRDRASVINIFNNVIPGLILDKKHKIHYNNILNEINKAYKR